MAMNTIVFQSMARSTTKDKWSEDEHKIIRDWHGKVHATEVLAKINEVSHKVRTLNQLRGKASKMGYSLRVKHDQDQ